MQKKSVLRLVVLLLVASVLLVALTGCGIFIRENKDRVANQTLYTVTNPTTNVSLTISQNEILDYFNNYGAMLVQYYGYSVEDALDFTIESKIKNKYLITVAMDALSRNYTKRANVLVSSGSVTKPEHALTYAEYAVAVYSANESVKNMLKTYLDDIESQKLVTAVGKIEKTDIKSVDFTDETKAYLKSEYYVGQEIDQNLIKIVVTYDDDTKTEPFVVPSTLYKTAFSSSEAGTDKVLEIEFEEKIYNEEKSKFTYESHLVSHTYHVVEPRKPKDKPAESSDPHMLQIGDVKVSRYATKQELADAGVDYGFRADATYKDLNGETIAYGLIKDFSALYAEASADPAFDKDLLDALRQLNENLARGYKTMGYIYSVGFESAVTSALQSEVQEATPLTEAELDALVLKEFKYLYDKEKIKYDEIKTDEDKQSTFAAAIKSSLESYYYHPKIADTENNSTLSDYTYVYQILFNFSDGQKAFIKEAGSDEDLKKEYMELMKNAITSKESNPNYDSAYACPKHGKGNTLAACKWEEEKEEGDTRLCPSLAYKVDANGDIVTASFLDVYDQMQTELLAAMGGDSTATLTKEQQDAAFKVFEDYMYRFNDDGGIMNHATGYLIVPEGTDDPNGFYEEFVKLGQSVYEHNNSVGNAFVKGGTLGYAFTDYGVHIIMTSMRPFESIGDDELKFADDAAMLAFIKSTKTNLKGDTIYETIKAKLVSDDKSAKYNAFTNEKIAEKLHEDAEIVEKNKKQIKKLYEEYVG